MKWQIPANERYDDDNEWINGIRLTSETRGMLIAWSMGVASLMGVAGAVLLKDQWRHDVFLADDEWRVHHFISRRLSDIPAGREGGGRRGGRGESPIKSGSSNFELNLARYLLCDDNCFQRCRRKIVWSGSHRYLTLEKEKVNIYHSIRQ